MKWIAGVTVLCLAIAAVAWFPGRSEWQCALNLSVFDHAINCTGHVAMMTEDGNKGTNGVWKQEYILGMTPQEYRRCPTAVTNYVLTFVVGQHPYCPVHGHLIEKYDLRPHGPNVRFGRQMLRENVAGVCGVVGIIGVFVMGFGFIVAGLRKRRDHPPVG